MKEAIERLQNMLSWSDRLGSDEINEIEEIIEILEEQKLTSKIVTELSEEKSEE